MTEELVEQKQWMLNANDRCDACQAQAYVYVKGLSGDLLFCGHHYKTLDGEKLKAFAFEIIDETERLVENKSQGDDY